MKTISAYTAFKTLLIRDLTLGVRNQSDFVNPLIFFIMVVTMFPLTVGPEQTVLQKLAPAIVWVAALLASSLSLEGIFRSDFEDGSLEQILLSPHSGLVLVSAKILAHWVLSGAPLIVLVLFSSVLLYLPNDAVLSLFFTLLIGTPVLSLVGSIAAALTIGLRSSGMLQVLLILPLVMPLLIFSVSAVNNSIIGLSVAAEMYFLGAILVLALTLAPLTVLSALRIRLG